MKLLSDFDGVWTHPGDEAHSQGQVLDERLIDAAPRAARAAARDWIASARRRVAAEPTRWGWVHEGRIAAFADEDPFGAHSGLLHLLSECAAGDPLAARMRDQALAQGGGSLDAFGLAAHLEGVERVERTRGPGVLAAATRAGRELLDSGAEVVVVSNSTEEKLVRWLEGAGMPHVAHPRRAPGALRLRGSARKHVLAARDGQVVDLDGTRVQIDRPHYEAILREELPDGIVGDVFSLDLALPLALKRSDPAWRRVRLFWLVQDYTPERMRKAIAASAPEVEPVAGGLTGVARALLG